MLGGKVKKHHTTVAIMIAIFLAVYLMAAFFLKSEYPLSSHLFNGKDAYDVLKDALGLVSPFAIAYIIYQIWHSQKGKEVVASEARELIKDYLEYTTHLAKLLHATPKIHDELVSEVERFKNLKLKIFRGLQYFTECMEDNNLEILVDEYINKEDELEQVMNFMGRRLGPSLFKKDIESAEPQINALVSAMEKVIMEIKPYSTYQKSFKFK